MRHVLGFESSRIAREDPGRFLLHLAIWHYYHEGVVGSCALFLF